MTDHAYCDKIRNMESLLKGNGHEGYFEKVDNHERFLEQSKGALMTIKWALGFIGISQIILLIKSFVVR